MYQYKLEKNDTGYSIIIYLDPDSEFASEFKDNKNNNKNSFNDQIKTIYNNIKERYPKLIINSIKIVIGGILLSTIAINLNEVKAESINPNNTIQVSNQTYITQNGDSLWTIANNHNITVNDLKTANQLTSDTIPIGMRLIIPSSSSSSMLMNVKYIVQKDDSLWSIANKYNTTVNNIKQANNLYNDNIQIGDVLLIPKTITTTDEPIAYTVQKDDSLWSIANKYNTNVNDLKVANNLTTDQLQIGDTLVIPKTINTITYTVQANDSLWSIANRYNTTVNDLKVANKLTTDQLQIGDTLVIPKTTTTPVINTTTYTVQANDSLWSIANKYNTTVNDLKVTNKLTTDQLQIGDTLVIPKATTTPTINTTTYTVQANDSLWSIANRYNTNVNALKVANNLTTDQLQIGDTLVIPKTINTITYTVQANDSLWSIANRYNTTVNDLKVANKLTTDQLQIGDTLVIPKTTTTPTTNTTTYIVQANDSLWSIANKYNTTVNSLKVANKLTTDQLQIGDTLVIPKTTTTNTTNTTTYTAQANDSLWSIANKYNTTVDTLKNYNNLTTDTLNIGQVLKVPNTSPQQTQTKDILYRVKSGDTIDSIANAHNISAQRLMSANNLSSRNIINNQALIIPLGNTSNVTSIDPTTYYVKSGDNLWSISKEFAVSAESIKQASNLRSDSLTIGQKLIIPTTIASTDYNRTTLEWLIEAQYNMKPDSVFHDVTVRTTELWKKATKDQIRFYTNPENFRNDKVLKYQFLKLNYHSGITNSDLNNLLNNKGVFSGHGATFNQASVKYNVSQVYLVSHALLETGNGTTPLAKGILVREVDGKAVTPRVVYNMFGINAVDSNPNKYGSEYAYKQGWFSVEKAIEGGAKWISDNYINNPTYKQNTLYKMRYNPSQTGVHQYSTDVAWAYNQTFNIYNLVKNYPEYYFQFDIPEFNPYYKV